MRRWHYRGSAAGAPVPAFGDSVMTPRDDEPVLPDRTQFFPVEVRLRGEEQVVVWCSQVTFTATAIQFENGRAVGFSFGTGTEGVASIATERVNGEVKVHPHIHPDVDPPT
jgi:hypothetical protein